MGRVDPIGPAVLRLCRSCNGAARRRAEEEFEMLVRDQKKDQERIVAGLADEAHVPIRDVADLYEQVRSGLAQSAHVKNYLSIFTTRNVRAILRRAASA